MVSLLFHMLSKRSLQCVSLLMPAAEIFDLKVDGGVKVDNIGELAALGADTFVAGSAIFNTDGLYASDLAHES